MDTVRSLGLDADGRNLIHDRRNLVRYINLKLAALGHELPTDASNRDFLAVAHDLLANHREQSRLLSGHLCPADQRIQDFLDRHLAGEPLVGPVRLPASTFVLDRHGLARELSLPVGGDDLSSPALTSYRIHQGILHNPRNDRRTTKGVFHVAEGGLPIPADKLAVPRKVFGNLMHHAMRPPAEHLRLPFTAGTAGTTATAGGGEPVELFVSLLLRPLVRPEIPGISPAKTMEVRLFAPGSLVSNLDFVESIFGNAGDPSLPENDAALDAGEWTGHTGCVILAPHLVTLTKRELGLPHVDQANERQRKDGMCWSKPDEPYNGGSPFKIACRTTDGVMVTILADNYYGYCKKEVKTQISFSANLSGGCEEEHAGGAIAFASFNLGEEFHGDNNTVLGRGHSFAEACSRYAGKLFDLMPDGHGVDRAYPDVLYMPESVRIELAKSRVTWTHGGVERSLALRPATTFVHPSGYKVRLEKHPGAPTWRLVGTVAEGVYCHKPCTVSGGGKSEISKSINDAMLYGPIFISDVERDLKAVAEIFEHDYSTRFLPHVRPDYVKRASRSVLDPQRSLGSLIKLLTPSTTEFTPEYNRWLGSIAPDIRALAFIIKRFYRPEWGEDWRKHFSVDIVNGQSGHEFKYRGRKLVGSYLRVGQLEGSWRTFKLRQDFIAAMKVPAEDDISVSAVVRSDLLPGLNREHCGDSVKIVANCEYRFFQRPDDAIHRGYDKQAEADMAGAGLFASNYRPLNLDDTREIVEDAIGFSQYSEPMRARLSAALADKAPYVLSSAHPRIVDGKITKNPRYLQVRPDLVNHREKYLAVVGARLFRRLPMEVPVVFPVHAVLPGRRNNPPEPEQNIRELAVYGPLHYQELPELFVDLIASLSGKSPSTTGWGSEGALTKGPFNAVRATADLNNAIVSAILTGGWGFTTPAGHIGPQVQIDHDISLLVPEMWCRMTMAERDPAYLMREGHLERIEDFDHGGRRVLASRLGWRVTSKFVHTFLGRIFDTPAVVFSEQLLRPETQDREAFAAGMELIVESQRQAAQAYLDDGSIEEACPPLAAILQVMARGDWQGRGLDHPELRKLFSRDQLLASTWYRHRLQVQQGRESALWRRHVADLEAFMARPSHADEATRLDLVARLASAKEMLATVAAPEYAARLEGTIGADPMGQAQVQTAARAR